jgi:hypothetical protein
VLFRRAERVVRRGIIFAFLFLVLYETMAEQREGFVCFIKRIMAL